MKSSNPEALVKSYSELNNSFRKTLTFHLGADAGFFSEFNNMVFAILYCLQNRIKFRLYSKRGNLSYKEGWQDYFLPFCEETDFYPYRRYNKRAYQVKNARSWPPTLLKLLTANSYLTQDIWDKFRSKEFESAKFNVPDLGITNASLPDAAQVIGRMLWRYNESAATQISKYKNSISLPENYISMQIRGGDKSKEKEIYTVESYMEDALNLSISKNIFVLTDNYRIIQELKAKYAHWKFSTLCNPSEKGYVHHEFVKLSKQERYMKVLKLLASIDICASSEHFIGTYSSNPGNYLAMRMGKENFTGIDYNEWLLW